MGKHRLIFNKTNEEVEITCSNALRELLLKSGRYRKVGSIINVNAKDALDILEAERIALIKEREAFELEIEAFKLEKEDLPQKQKRTYNKKQKNGL